QCTDPAGYAEVVRRPDVGEGVVLPPVVELLLIVQLADLFEQGVEPGVTLRIDALGLGALLSRRLPYLSGPAELTVVVPGARLVGGGRGAGGPPSVGCPRSCTSLVEAPPLHRRPRRPHRCRARCAAGC